MDRWKGKVAIVTGASSGIGAAIAVDFAKVGIITIAVARRVGRIEELKKQLSKETIENLIPRKCDVRDENEIKDTFEWIEKNYGGVDISVNNAGIFRRIKIVKGEDSNDLRNVINTNVLAHILCIRESFRLMKERGQPGHIFITNSILGHNVVNTLNSPRGSLNIYPPTKFALTALTEVVRQELIMEKTRIKITSISPGTVRTEIDGDPEIIYKGRPYLLPQDVSDAVLYALGTPEHVQVHELTLKPVGEPF